jgi:hypothetical protein
MVWHVRFQIEKRSCGSEVIVSQSWKSSKKWMCESGWVMWRWCTLNTATIRKQLLGEYHHNSFQLHMQRKDESFDGCRFCAPAKCTPKLRQIVHREGECDARLPFHQFFDSSCTKLNKGQWHHFECAQEERAAFFYAFIKSEQKKVAKLHVLEAPKNSLVGSVARLPFHQFFDSSCTKLNKGQWHHFECAQEERAAFLYAFIKSEQKKSGKIACFGGTQKQPCGLCCATPVSSVL